MPLSDSDVAFIIASPVMLIVGLCFAVSISVNPHVSTLGKAIGWPLSIMIGYTNAVELGAQLLPHMDKDGQALLMFGTGFWFTWMFIGIVFHDDRSAHILKFGKSVGLFLFRRARGIVKSKTSSTSGEPTKYKAYASKREGQ